MYDVKPFLLSILDTTGHDSALVLADWLEERGDEFAAELRRPQVGPAIVAVFRRWCNEFGFTPTLELLKDAAKMRISNPIRSEVATTASPLNGGFLRPITVPYIPTLDPTPYDRPVWEWRPDDTRWTVDETTKTVDTQ